MSTKTEDNNISDGNLFKKPPLEDCPICFLRLPSLHSGWKYKSCCGKVICSGCFYANAKMEGNVDQLCPFCRTPIPISDEEDIEGVTKRVKVGDAIAIHNLGGFYSEGMKGLSRDWNKALELWHRAGELGYFDSHFNIGNAY